MPSTPVNLNAVGFAHGGEAIARNDGKVIFVRGALPGEQITVQLTEERRNYARGQLLEVLTPSPHRRDLDCQKEIEGCGGCGRCGRGERKKKSVAIVLAYTFVLT